MVYAQETALGVEEWCSCARTQFTRFVTSRFVGKPSNLNFDATASQALPSPSQPLKHHVHPHKPHPRPQCILISTPKKFKRVRPPHLRFPPTTLSTLSNNFTPDCADVVAALDECHARGFLWKVTGNCTDAKYKVNMCLRAQRLERTRVNREVAKEKREKIEKVWAELDANK
jgi:COX assembly protein 2